MCSFEFYLLCPQQGGHQVAHVVFQPMQWGREQTLPCGRGQFNMRGQNECHLTITPYPLNHATMSKEVRKCLEEARPIRVRCKTNEIGEIYGLKTKFEDAIKSVAYSILDLNARSFACQSRKSIKFVDEEARKQFEFYPYPLREGYTERYLREHLKQTRNKWKSWWLAYGDSTRPHDCPDDVWRCWIRYWKTPAAEEESMKGKERRSKARTPSKTGRTRTSDAYEDEVMSFIGVGYGGDQSMQSMLGVSCRRNEGFLTCA